jgi:hypothetical protein
MNIIEAECCLTLRNNLPSGDLGVPQYSGISERLCDCLDRLCGLARRLQIQRPGFHSQHYQILWQVVGLERGPLSLVSTTEELLDRKVAALV